MLFGRNNPQARDILPWWHPWSILRMLWNIAFSIFLGAAISGIICEIIAQVAARIAGGEWRDWSESLVWLNWGLGCFIAYVSYMSYRMDDKAE